MIINFCIINDTWQLWLSEF